MVLAIVAGVALVWWVSTLDPGGELDDSGDEPTAAPMPSEAPVASPSVPNTVPAAPATPAPPPPAAANTEATAKPSPQPGASTDVQIPVPTRSGPIDELKQAFEREPRASGGTRFEAAIEAQFRKPEVPAALLESVICRTTVCRIQTRWSPERAEGFMGAFMHLLTPPAGPESLFDGNLAISPAAEDGPDGTRAIDVYLKLAAPSAKTDPL